MIRLIFALFYFLATAATGGTLYGYPHVPAAYYDWNYLQAKSQPYTALSGTFSMSARFTWDGVPGQSVTNPQHAVVAYTQRQVATGYFNLAGEESFTHGAGAFVGERGLEMELWFRQNNAGNAYVWNQDNNRCARDVQGTLPPGSMCLASNYNAGGYITSAPGFQLTKGVQYTLKVKLSQSSPGWTKLEAELYKPAAFGQQLVQSGMMGFPSASFFPVVNQHLTAAVARTPGEPLIQYTVLP